MFDCYRELREYGSVFFACLGLPAHPVFARQSEEKDTDSLSVFFDIRAPKTFFDKMEFFVQANHRFIRFNDFAVEFLQMQCVEGEVDQCTFEGGT